MKSINHPMTATATATLLADLRTDISITCTGTAFDLERLEEATSDLLMAATQTVEIAAEMAEDIRQAALGNIRVCCQWCDGEFFADATNPGPHTCHLCRHCDGH